MAIKMTSDPFTIRGQLKHTVDLTTGQSGSDFSVLEIDQQLDTLSREILVIHEVDFEVLLKFWPHEIADFGDAIVAAVGKAQKGSRIATFDKKFVRALHSLGLQTVQL